MDCFSFVDFAFAWGQLGDYYVCRFIIRAEHSSLGEHLLRVDTSKLKKLEKCEIISHGEKTIQVGFGYLLLFNYSNSIELIHLM